MAAFAMLACLLARPLSAADEASVSQKAQDAAKETTTAVEKAGTAVADEAKSLWQRIDAARLKNRTPDEIVAWFIVGVLVGAVAGMMTKLKQSGMGAMGRLVLGLVGSFLGGIAVRVFKIDFGWGPVLIRYEELVFALLGAIIILVIWKLISSRSKKKEPAH
jgi:uncharacterized membrane protein YeaQ/YmgE (transglycosylase-associated protein family)